MARGPGSNLGDDMDYSKLTDDEIRRAVVEHLEADETVDASRIEVAVRNGRVRLSGSVGSEVERETVERIVTDLIGLDVAADRIRVETTAREGARAGATRGRDQATGMAQYEWESEPELSEEIGTEDPMEASDEARPFTPPESPVVDALFSTDPPHGVAAEDPRPLNETMRGRRVDEAVARTVKSAPDQALRHAATESAEQFKESMRRRGEREKG